MTVQVQCVIKLSILLARSSQQLEALLMAVIKEMWWLIFTLQTDVGLKRYLYKTAVLYSEIHCIINKEDET